MKANIRTKRYVICPACGQGDALIDHLKPTTSAGPWYCDECGVAYTVSVDASGEIDLTVLDKKMIRTYDLLVLPPQQKPVYFVVKGMRFSDDASDIDESKTFFYESHSCPVNWLQPELMASGGDDDPHGLIKFVRSVDASELPTEAWETVFPEIQ